MLRFRNLKKTALYFFNSKKISIYISFILILWLAAQLFITLQTVNWHHNNERVEFRIAGEYLKGEINPNNTITYRKRNYEYYIGKGNFVKLPDRENITRFFQEIEAIDYLIISKRIEVQFSPELKFLLDPFDDNIPDFLVPVFIYNVSTKRIVIYKNTL